VDSPTTRKTYALASVPEGKVKAMSGTEEEISNPQDSKKFPTSQPVIFNNNILQKKINKKATKQTRKQDKT
jgi:hypothetical protein